jgi:hypothetical protein
MPADEKAFEEVLSLHLGLLGWTGAGLSTLIRRDLEGVHADYTLEHAL